MGVTVCAVLLRSCAVVGDVAACTIILELFPTPIRNLVLGLASGVSYFTSMLAPFVAGTLVGGSIFINIEWISECLR